MPKFRFPLALALLAVIALPTATGAQLDAEASTPPASTVASGDTRLAELETIVPEYFAGLPLRENMQSAPGELLASRMDEDERALFEAMLEANDKTLADYAAANVPVRIDESTVIVIQPHRVTGIDAAGTLDAWGRILALDTQRPSIEHAVIAGHDVLIVSDEARPGFPMLHLLAAGDVVWMIVAQDAAVVEEAVRSLSAASAVPATE